MAVVGGSAGELYPLPSPRWHVMGLRAGWGGVWVGGLPGGAVRPSGSAGRYAHSTFAAVLVGGLSRPRRAGGRVAAVGLRVSGVGAVAAIQWAHLITTLWALAQVRVGFVLQVRPAVGVWARALGWHTWAGAHVSYRRACGGEGLGGVGSVCVLHTRGRMSVAEVRAWAGLGVPLVGLGSSKRVAALLWQGVPVAYSPAVEYLMLLGLWAACVAVCGAMSAGTLLVALLGVSALTLGCLRSWAQVGLCALIEVCWVCVCCVVASAALGGGGLGLVYWAFVLLVFSAVELCVALFLFVLLAQVSGEAEVR